MSYPNAQPASNVSYRLEQKSPFSPENAPRGFAELRISDPAQTPEGRVDFRLAVRP